MQNKKIIFFIFLTLLFGCHTNKLDVDVSDVQIELEFHSFEKEIISGKTLNEMTDVNSKCWEIGDELYEFYLVDMLRVGFPEEDSTPTFLNMFANDSMMKILNKNIIDEFGDFSEEKNRIEDIFKRLKYHLPNALQPTKVITYNSTFTNGVVSTPEKIGIGLDMYLGKENELIQKVGFPAYFKEKMDKKFLPVDVAQSWIMFNVLEDQRDDTFLSNLIYYGKILYAVDALMPDLPDHIKIKYTQEEFEWAELSEYNVWQYIIEQNWVYSKEIKLIVRYFNEGPTTVGLDGSPSRYGQYIGWQIVKAYMDKNDELEVKDLMAETNFTKILKAYKPKQKN